MPNKADQENVVKQGGKHVNSAFSVCKESEQLAASTDQHREPSGILAIENAVGQQHRSSARMDIFHMGQRFSHNTSIG